MESLLIAAAGWVFLVFSLGWWVGYLSAKSARSRAIGERASEETSTYRTP